MRASGVPRADIFLTTKVSHENLRADDFARSVDESLKALKVDYVDLLLVHWPNPEIAAKEYMPALAKAKRDGLARHIGVANFTTRLLDEAIALCPEPLVALQAEYHPYLDQTKLLAAVRRHGLVFIAYCPLARGRLFDDPVLAAIAKARGRSIAQIALRWLLQQTSPPYRSRRTRSVSPTISRCSISRLMTTRWPASPRSSGRTAASPILRGGSPAGGIEL